MFQKKAILIVSFGTSYKETKEKTLDKIEEDISKAYPDYKIYKAYTSKIIIKKLKETYNISIYTIKEALNKILDDGIKDIIIQPTHVINGVENHKIISEINSYKDNFNSIFIGSPLVNNSKDISTIIDILKKEFSFVKRDEAIIFMGHGTNYNSNKLYSNMNHIFKEKELNNFFMITMKDYSDINNIIKELKAITPKKIYLTPFMVVAGNHAINDMSSDKDNSLKRLLEKEGFNVQCIIKGLGEYKSIRQLYIDHIKYSQRK